MPTATGAGLNPRPSAVLPVISASARLARLRPRGLDPVRRRRRLVMAMARLRPIRRCGDVADRDCDDPVGIPDRERIVRQALAEAGDSVLVALVVVWPDVDIARRRIHAQAFELADDRFLLGPAADQLVRSE